MPDLVHLGPKSRATCGLHLWKTQDKCIEQGATGKKPVKICRGNSGRSGAEDRSRTDDLLITNQLLYQLSYFGLLS